MYNPLRALRAKIKAYRANQKYLTFLDSYNTQHNTLVRPGALINERTVAEERVRLEPGANFCDSKVGRYTYSGAASLPNCDVGRFCSIADGVRLVAYTHPTSFVSVWPGFFHTIIPSTTIQHFNDNLEFNETLLCEDGRVIHIGNDVWIGQNVSIMGGVSIGDGAIVGANALVTKDVPPYAIVGGVPAKIIRFRFQPNEIEFLLSLKWWDWDLETLQKYAPYFDSVRGLKTHCSAERL